MTDLRVLDELEAQLKGALYPDHGPRRVGRRLWLAPAGGVAVAAIVIAAVLVSSGSVKTPVAAALDRAARAAEQRAATPAIGPGQFWYTRISGADRLPLPTPRRPGSKPPAGVPPVAWVMQRSTTETWVGTDGTVRTRNVPIGTPKINTAGDSTAQGDDRLPPNLELFHYRELLSLPTDPHALYARIHRALAAADARAQRDIKSTEAELRRQQAAGESVSVKIWTAGGPGARGAAELSAVKHLLEAPVPAAVRAALYRAAALIPGVHYDGDVHDSLGRAGAGVSAGNPGSEFELIFDPATGALLGQHSPVIGDSATVAAGVVDSITALPRGVAPIAAPKRIARVPIAVRPSIGGARTTFAVRLRQRVSAGTYFFSVTGPMGPRCRPVIVPIVPPRTVRGTRAGRELVHRLRPPAGGWCAGSFRVQVGDLGSVRFGVR